jgi:hypothetical protein
VEQVADDEPTSFVIRVWKRNGHLIVQVNKNDFSVYGPDGCFVGTKDSFDGALGLTKPMVNRPKG